MELLRELIGRHGRLLAASLVAAVALAACFAPAGSAQAKRPAAPRSLAAPSISGTPTVGRALAATPGKWSGAQPIRFTYQWQRCSAQGARCQNIKHASAKRYTLALADAGQSVRVLVSAANKAGSAQARSAAKLVEGAPLNTKAPSISGTDTLGQLLRASAGTWTGAAPISYSFQWQRCSAAHSDCQNIPGQQTSAYTLSAADVAQSVQVSVSAANAAGSAAASSPASAPVSAPPASSAAPSITGQAVVGQTLSASPGAWLAYPAPSYSYQWERCDHTGVSCSPIAGQSALTYTISPADSSYTLAVAISASNTLGAASAQSAPSALITEAPVNTTVPAITGLAQRGSELDGQPGAWTGYPAPAYAYQWERCDAAGCQSIPGASTDAYTPVLADVGDTLELSVSAANTAGSQSAQSPPTGTVAATPTSATLSSSANPSPAGEPLTYTASVTPVPDAGTVSFSDGLTLIAQCAAQPVNPATGLASCTAPDYASAAVHSITAAYSGDSGYQSSASASFAQTIFDAPPTLSAPPSISGIAQDSQTLSASTGAWAGTPSITYSYQWQACTPGCVDIAGQTNSTITPTDAQIGAQLQVLVTASNAAGSASASSAQTPAVLAPPPPEPVSAPSISGTTTDGQTLAASTGTWTSDAPTLAPLSFTYQWQRCPADSQQWAQCTPVGSAASTYQLSPADIGDVIRVQVSATNAATSASSLFSGATAPIAAAAPANTSAPTITGLPDQGNTLIASTGTWTGTPAISYSYQWQDCDPDTNLCTNVAGADSDAYLLGPEDGSHRVQVIVTADNSAVCAALKASGCAAVTASAETAVVLAAPTLSRAPSAKSAGSAPSFGFAALGAASYSCQLDSGAPAPCTSPVSYTGLTDGSHSFTVQAANGALSGPPQTYSWSVDASAPSITATPASLSAASAPSFSFSHSESSYTFQCSLDSAAFSSCASPFSYTGLANGLHTFTVQALSSDGYASQSASYSWTVDASAPSFSQTPPELSNTTTPTFGFAHTEPTYSFSCELDSGGYQPCSSPEALSSLSQGTHTFSVQALDSAGAPSASVSYTWLVDTVAPTDSLALAPGAVGAYLNAGTLYYNPNAAGSFSLTDSVSDAGSGPASASFGAIDAAGWTHDAETISGQSPYSSQAFSWSADPSNPSPLTVSSKDKATNQSAGQTLSFVADAGELTGGALTMNGTAASAQGSSSTTSDVAFAIGSRSDYTDAGSGLASSTLTVQSELLSTGVCGAPGSGGPFTSPVSITATTQPAGIVAGYCYLYTLTGTDNVGNSASVSSTVHLPPLSPLNFLWYTIHETSAVSGCRLQTFYYNSTIPAACELSWASGDTVNGPMYTQDQLYVGSDQSPVFGRGPQDEIASQVPTSGVNDICVDSDCQDATILGTPAPDVTPQIPLPLDDSQLLTDAQSHGVVLSGTTTLTLSGTSASGYNCPGTSSSDPCTPVTLDLSADPVIYASNASGCDPSGYDPTSVSYQESDSVGDAVAYYGPCGDIYISGTYTAPATFAAADDIVVSGDITTSTDADGDLTGAATLGLIADHYVRVMHGSSVPADCTSNPDVSIDAAVMALQDSFVVDNYKCGGLPQGTLTVDGSIAQDYRGAVATSGASGYHKNYTYDDRLEATPPPYVSDLLVPENITAPSVTGTLAAGQTLTVNAGTWSELPTSYTYTWEDCDASGTCTPNGAPSTSTSTSESYTVAPADLDGTLAVLVCATNAAGASVEVKAIASGG